MQTLKPATQTAAFQVAALPQDDLTRIRAAGVDDFGNPLRPFEAEGAGAPLRCCLREARPGERIALIAYRPFRAASPYAEVGPIFIHADECAGYADPAAYPAGLQHRRVVLRAYDQDGAIAYADFVDGDQAEAAIADYLARPEIAFLHFRAQLHGCYLFEARRAG